MIVQINKMYQLVILTDVYPDLLCDKLRETLSKSVMLESDYTMVKMVLDEFLKVRCISRKQYKRVCEKIRLIKN